MKLNQESIPSVDELRRLGIVVTRDGSRTMIRLPGGSPLAAGLVVLIACVCVFVFIAALYAMYNNRSLPPAHRLGLGALVTLLLSLGAYSRRRSHIARGEEDLVIDSQIRTLTLPATFNRAMKDVVRFDNVAEVRVLATHGAHAVILAHRDEIGVMQAAKLAQWREETRAAALAEFVRVSVNVTATHADA